MRQKALKKVLVSLLCAADRAFLMYEMRTSFARRHFEI